MPELVAYHKKADLLEVTISDNGTGIKEADQAKLFSLYGFIANSKEVNTRGIGLGLHICRKIVNQLGGEIVCRSVWGAGSTFVFVVSLKPVIEGENMPEKQ